MTPALPPFTFVLLLLLFLCNYNSNVNGDNQGFEVVKVERLKQGSVCTESKVPSRNSVKVVHRLGPCFLSGQGLPDDDEILSEDSLRVAYLQHRIRLANKMGNKSTDPLQASLEVRLPARSANTIGNNNYVLTIAVGTPPRNQTVIFDTGSDVCWLQCRPCRQCYQQLEPIFDSAASPTYRNVTCNEPACTRLRPSDRDCINNICVYRLRYMDGSSTTGFLAMDRLGLMMPGHSPFPLPNFVFGCGHTNIGFRGAAAGAFGLARTFHSLVSQASSRLENVFSYCLPALINYTGYLTLGRGPAPAPRYVRMLGRPTDPALYFIELVGISVAMRRLPLSTAVFRREGTIIDSGTVISRLPPGAYRELRAAFSSGMSQYGRAPPVNLLDTCYHIGTPEFAYPQIVLHFNNFDHHLTMHQVFYVSNDSIYCLGFAASQGGSGGIIGNLQQRGMEVIYDIEGQRIGFSRGTNCH